MKRININIILGLFALLALVSCEDKEGRTVFPHSTPVIESASLNPTSFVYGDSVTITAKVSDPVTPLSTLQLKMIVNDQVIATQIIRTKDYSTEVSAKFKVNYVPEVTDNGDVQVELSLINVEGDVTKGSITGIKGFRTYYKQLYLVLDNGKVITLTPEGQKSDKYKSPDVDLKNKIRYKIAEKITADNQIDFSGDVWGWQDNKIKLVDESGDYITTAEPMKKSTTGIVFDTYAFATTLSGQDLVNVSSLKIGDFKDTQIAGETFKEGSFYIEKNKKIVLSDELKDAVFNLDYFERLAPDTVKFVGETGPWTLDYNSARRYVIVQDLDPNFPNVLLACGEGLGYPSKVKQEATSSWGFDQIKQYIQFKKIAENIYQGTVYFDAEKANFKFFENKGWGNEKKSDDYTLPSILKNSKGTDGNWFASESAESGNYKITIDLGKKKVTAEAVTLP